MVDLTNLADYRTEVPQRSFLGTDEEALALSAEHQAQIHFLSPEATTFVQAYMKGSHMVIGPTPGNSKVPFRPGYFKQVERVGYNSDAAVKKWLYRRGIPFGRYVLSYVDPASKQAVLLTWKMVIKYAAQLFGPEDLLLFDQTLNWGLFYDHSSGFAYGRDKVLDNEVEYQKMAELAALKKKYSFIKTPY